MEVGSGSKGKWDRCVRTHQAHIFPNQIVASVEAPDACGLVEGHFKGVKYVTEGKTKDQAARAPCPLSAKYRQ